MLLMTRLSWRRREQAGVAINVAAPPLLRLPSRSPVFGRGIGKRRGFRNLP